MYIYESQRDNTGVLYNITTIGIIFYIALSIFVCSTFVKTKCPPDSFFLCKMVYKHLSRGTADEEPLVDGSVDLLGGDLLMSRQRRKLVRADTRRRVLDSDVGAVYELVWILHVNQDEKLTWKHHQRGSCQ
jgi:hypothetical protein